MHHFCVDFSRCAGRLRDPPSRHKNIITRRRKSVALRLYLSPVTRASGSPRSSHPRRASWAPQINPTGRPQKRPTTKTMVSKLLGDGAESNQQVTCVLIADGGRSYSNKTIIMKSHHSARARVMRPSDPWIRSYAPPKAHSCALDVVGAERIPSAIGERNLAHASRVRQLIQGVL